MLIVHGQGQCYRCGKPATKTINLNANAAGGSASNMVSACEECHPSQWTLNERRIRRLEVALRDISKHSHDEQAVMVANAALKLKD